ncbi:transcriptional regulator, HxlR family [Lampropedia hyalina DSM 16112]|jgi:DNA-binding HxlR family transcriptional regulator|uniref:Transcriptional regulator, HxlR family n=1 Tax=Lampropedia hyalina DSM 16112 TaxID=1122156 RepID=A0A1M5B449_9BURK|nr:helix-turn-helix domain-containing protein [Lampropedia hyalina]SHF37225.1 transcriptional regulator, HxlR family [Lampropedia hyalina DSM 16112]
MPRIPHPNFHCAAGCTVEATLTLIGGKWKGVILYRLLTEQVLRFNELRRLLPNITQRMLTHQLRELEGDGLIARKVYPEVPPKVEYRLTDYGQTLAPVIHALKAWGDAHVDRHTAAVPSATVVPRIQP